MTKGAYNVKNDTYVGPSKDASFRSCLCAMLVFVSICGIILVVAWPWRNSGGTAKPSSPNYGSADQQKGNQYPYQKNKPEDRKENESIKPIEGTTSKPEEKPSKPEITTTTERDTESVGAEVPKQSPGKSEKIQAAISDNSSSTTETVPIKPEVKNDKETTNKPEIPVTTNESLSVTQDLSNRTDYKPETVTVINTHDKDKNETDSATENTGLATEKPETVEVVNTQDKDKNETDSATENTGLATEKPETVAVVNRNNKDKNETDSATENTGLATEKPETVEVVNTQDKDKNETDSATENTELATEKPETVEVVNRNNKDKNETDSATENTGLATEKSETIEVVNRNNKDKNETDSATENTGLATEKPETVEVVNRNNKDKNETDSATENTGLATEKPETVEVINRNNKDKNETDSATENTELATEKPETIAVVNTQDKDKNETDSATENTELATEKPETVEVVNRNNKDKNETDSATENTGLATEKPETVEVINRNNKDKNETDSATENTELATEKPETIAVVNTQDKDKNETDSATENTGLATEKPETVSVVNTLDKDKNETDSATENTELATEKPETVAVVNTQDKDKNETDSATENTELATEKPETVAVVNTQDKDRNETDSATENTELATEKPETVAVVNTQDKDRNETDSATENTELATEKPETVAVVNTQDKDKNETDSATENTELATEKPETVAVVNTQDKDRNETDSATENTELATEKPETVAVVNTQDKDRNETDSATENTELATEKPETVTVVNALDKDKKREDSGNENNEDITDKLQNEVSTLQSTYIQLKPNVDHTTRPTPMETSGDDLQYKSTTPSKSNFNQIIVPDKCGSECRKVGARILSRMNYSADACEHFYDYACGGDNNDNAPEDNWKRIAAGLDRVHAQSPASFITFRKFYENCLDFHTDYDYDKRLDEARFIMSSVGEPYTDKNKVDIKSALTDLLTRLLQLDNSPLFDISVDVDKQSQNFTFQLNIGKRFSALQNDDIELATKRKCLHQSKKHFDFSVSFFDSINLNEMYEVYSSCQHNGTYKAETLDKAILLFGYDEDLEDSVSHVEEILQTFELVPSSVNIRKDIVRKKFVMRKVSELAFHYPLIDWKQILMNLVGKDVPDEHLVQVYFSEFFVKMFGRQQKLTKPELYNAIFAMFAHDLYINTILPTSMENPEKYCLQQSSELMKEVASSLYLDSIIPKDIEGDEERIKSLFGKMKSKLNTMIQDAEWASMTPKNTLIDKLNNMELEAWNSSLIWKDVTLVQERMETVNRNFDNYSDFATALVRRNRQMLYNMWDTPASEEQNIWWYFLTPYTTNPVSIYALNKIVIPPAMLSKNSKDIPRYLSLANLGFSLAKAIAYHFDHTGSKFEISLDEESQMAYDEVKTCTQNSYKQKEIQMEFDDKNIQFKVNDNSLELSSNERFVEDVALNLVSSISNEDITDYKISWISNSNLAEDFTREKLFFIALGQEHCRKSHLDDMFLHLFESENLPPFLLLDQAVSHSQIFNDAFKCKDGAGLNPEYKCKPFPSMEV